MDLATIQKHLPRLADLLHENALVRPRYDAEFAAAMTWAAAHFRSLQPVVKRRLSPAAKREAEDQARSWVLTFAAAWGTDRKAPTVRELLAAAHRDIPDVPDRYIIKARLPEWYQPPGRPKNV